MIHIQPRFNVIQFKYSCGGVVVITSFNVPLRLLNFKQVDNENNKASKKIKTHHSLTECVNSQSANWSWTRRSATDDAQPPSIVFFSCFFFQYLLIDSGLRLCDQQPDELFVLTSSGSEETSYETSECFPLLSEKPFVNNTNLHWLVLIRPFIHQVNSLKKSSALISIPVGIDLLSVDVDGRLAVA